MANNYVKGLIEFFFKNHPAYPLNVIRAKIHAGFNPSGVDCNILSNKESMDLLLSGNRSLIRWGDADTRLVLKGNIYYQKYNKKLRQKILQILDEYNEDSNYILAIPSKITKSDAELHKDNEAQFWQSSKLLFRKHVKKNVAYADSLIFYSEEVNEKFFGTLIDRADNVIFGHFSQEIFDTFAKNNPAKKCFYLKMPESHAFVHKDNLKKGLLDIFEKNNLQKENTVMFLSCGPTARILIYELSKEGYWAIDVGTFFARKYKGWMQ